MMHKSHASREETDAVLARLLAAWKSRNAKEVAAQFANDGVYAASVGPEPGARAKGPAAIEALVGRMFAVDDGASSEIIGRVPTETGAFWSWRYILPDGKVELGCDLIVVCGQHIMLKDAYRKVRRS